MIANTSSGGKITIAHMLPWSGIGGVEIATLRIVEATRDQFRHVAFCLYNAPTVREMFEQAGIETVSYIPPEPSLLHGLRYFHQSRLIARDIRKAGATIIHFAEVKAAYHCSLAALIAGVRQMCHVRVSIPNLDARYKLTLLPLHSFVFVSKEAMETFAVSLPHSRTRVVYDAIEIPEGECTSLRSDVRREFGIADSVLIIGMVARVSPQKDYFTLANAAADVLARFPELRFLIVGDNSRVDLNRAHYAEVAARLNQLGIASSFVFTGHRDDVQHLASAMDIVVLPTHREGLPLSIIEAMALGKPVVATAVGGIPEIVIPGVNGYLHQHENSQELAAAIIDLVGNPERRHRLGNSAREYVRENYSLDRFAADMTRAYGDLVRS
jgi:glycosyltransferase involved in cell wall biosynthesis